ncbi:MAG TPA: neutral zinc metallopeptidase [Propionibacteriaceae bacterium]
MPPRSSTRRPRALLVVALSVVVAVLLAVTAGFVLVRRADQPVAQPAATTSTPVPTSSIPTPAVTLVRPASPSSTPPRSPSATPSSGPTPPGPDQSLKKNALYGIDLGQTTVSCGIKVRSPQPPLKNDKLAPYVRDVVDCLVKAFAEPLADEGITLTAPKVKTYKKSISTPCGKYGQDLAPAYYCSATQTIYWPQTSDDGREAYTSARLGYVGLAAHEFGHHLQATTGMLAEYGSAYYATGKKSSRYLLSRRLELQAQCFEGVFLGQATKSLNLTPYDRSQLRTWHSYTGDEDPPPSRKPDHGTSAAQIRWLERGLESSDFGRCNTWTASKKAVK